jgi:hypothetical protein
VGVGMADIVGQDISVMGPGMVDIKIIVILAIDIATIGIIIDGKSLPLV